MNQKLSSILRPWIIFYLWYDQETIVDAIKDLAEKAEKVKAQEIEIEELYNK